MITLHHKNCLEILKTLPDASIDAVITDPPYLTTDLHFDKAGNALHNPLQWVHELLRVVKPNGYLALFSPVEMQAQVAQIWSMRFSGAWVKPAGSMRTHSAKKPMNQWELYCVFAHPKHKVSELTWNKATYETGKPWKKVKRNLGYKRDGKDQLDRSDTSAWTEEGYVGSSDGRRYYTDTLFGGQKAYMPMAERTIHPTQKPIAVVEVLVQWLTNSGETVLDPFMGSGTTGVAAKKFDRQFIGVECNHEYFCIARDRIESYTVRAQE